MANLIALSAGPALACHTVSAVLYGVSTIQMSVYFKRFAPVNAWTKTVLWSIWTLDTCFVGTLTAGLYEMIIGPLAQQREFDPRPSPILLVSMIFLALLTILVKGWLICKVGRMSLNRALIIACTLLGLAGGVVLIVFVVLMLAKGISIVEFEKLKWLILLSLALDIAFNAIVTASQLVFLWTRRYSAFPSTVSVIDKAMLWTIQSGAVTSLVYVVVLLCFILVPDMLWAGIAVLLPGVYVNSMLAILNGRRSLARMMAETVQEGPLCPPQPSIAIEMSRTFEVTADDGASTHSDGQKHHAIGSGTPTTVSSLQTKVDSGGRHHGTGVPYGLSPCGHAHAGTGEDAGRCPMAAAFLGR
ncbi:hypothetical protein BDV98DRAFT_416787 [Pterulicium gracile]|uniref:DUF6534 domain-containing protein n=1 Tax=Pterulicium gracile TaxID=1884261 RepID=A0A5C3QNG0_9AGAR|nr:hypothetical protein BDV98DRAFT_416787 [Pterula gracilis]